MRALVFLMKRVKSPVTAYLDQLGIPNVLITKKKSICYIKFDLDTKIKVKWNIVSPFKASIAAYLGDRDIKRY